jgi:3-oxoacyl-[acyl-carrier protein] reductase
MPRFEEIVIGTKAEITHLITDKDIDRFVALTGDDNKIHIDKEYAQNTSFKKPVVHGMLSAAFISTIIGTKIPGDGAIWYAQNLEFLFPVRVGDTITVVAEVIGKIPRINAIELQTDIYNQDRKKVITGKAKIKIIEQELAYKPNEENVSYKKVALVIGATGGIGSEACMKLAAMGYDIAIHYSTNEQKATSLHQKITEQNVNAYVIKADIGICSEVDNLVESVIRRYGHITLIVNCAALRIPNIKFDRLNWSDMANQLDFNVKSNYYLAKAIVPAMQKIKFGKIIFITTQVTDNTPPVEWMPYVTAKHALNGFAKSLAIELAPYNIQVNMVSPGMTDTDLIADIPEKARMLAVAKVPLKRLATAKDIAGAIGFLASEDAAYVTGQTIRINGGQSMI